MRSQLSILKYAALWVVMLALGLGLPTKAAAYSFTLIADSSGPFTWYVRKVLASAGHAVSGIALRNARGD
jgi:hypothetical protein